MNFSRSVTFAITPLLLCGCGLPPEPEIPRVRSLPAVVSLRDPGQSVLPEGSSDHVTLLYIWATWCGPCQQASPRIEQIAQKYKGSALRVMAVSTREGKSTVSAYLRKDPKALPIYLDEKGQLAEALEVTSIPVFVVLGPGGKGLKTVSGVSEQGFAEIESGISEGLRMVPNGTDSRDK